MRPYYKIRVGEVKREIGVVEGGKVDGDIVWRTDKEYIICDFFLLGGQTKKINKRCSTSVPFAEHPERGCRDDYACSHRRLIRGQSGAAIAKSA